MRGPCMETVSQNGCRVQAWWFEVCVPVCRCTGTAPWPAVLLCPQKAPASRRDLAEDAPLCCDRVRVRFGERSQPCLSSCPSDAPPPPWGCSTSCGLLSASPLPVARLQVQLRETRLL